MKKLLFPVFLLMALLPVSAQNEGNPFQRLGYNTPVYTFGEDKEFHDQEAIVEIGFVFYNTKTNKVVGFVEEEDSLVELAPELQSMSIDPLCEKYYSISPYAYCFNNPVKFVDPDGRSPYYTLTGQYLGTDVGGFSGQILIVPNKEIYLANVLSNVTTSDTYLIQDLSLAPEAVASIYTNILEQTGYSTDMLVNNSVSVISDKGEFNSPSKGVNKNTDFLKTEFKSSKASKFKITIADNDYSKKMLRTVENAQNAIGDHEYTSHGKNKKRDSEKNHHEAYEYQIDQPVFKQTTIDYQEIINSLYLLYLNHEINKP